MNNSKWVLTLFAASIKKNEMKKTRGGASSTGYYVRHNDIFRKTAWSEASAFICLDLLSWSYLATHKSCPVARAPAAMKISATSAVLLVMEGWCSHSSSYFFLCHRELKGTPKHQKNQNTIKKHLSEFDKRTNWMQEHCESHRAEQKWVTKQFNSLNEKWARSESLFVCLALF